MSIYGMGGGTSVVSPSQVTPRSIQLPSLPPKIAPVDNGPADIMSVIVPTLMELLKVVTQGVSGGQNQQSKPASSNLNYDDNSSIAQGLSEMTQGDPTLQGLITQAFNTDPTSPESQQIYAQISAAWKGSPEELQDAFKMISIGQMNTMKSSLNATLSNMDPEDPQTQLVQARLVDIETQRQDLIKQLEA